MSDYREDGRARAEAEPARPVPSDRSPAVLEIGQDLVSWTVLSMSQRHPDGRDADYLAWHLLDHLPEQYRIGAIRSGQRWVSTPSGQAAHRTGPGPFAEVDHLVSYLFADPLDPALDAFFRLGGELRRLGRMPMALPRVHVGVWALVDKAANPTAYVGADVVPWRPNRGVYLVVDRVAAGDDRRSDRTARLAGVAGVAGAWRFRGTSGRHPRAQDCADLEATLCYLDADPAATAPAIAACLADESEAGGSLLLAAPFESVVPFDWSQVRPGAPA